jgi:hypothetical protein
MTDGEVRDDPGDAVLDLGVGARRALSKTIIGRV